MLRLSPISPNYCVIWGLANFVVFTHDSIDGFLWVMRCLGVLHIYVYFDGRILECWSNP
ncbi:hypothetical protein BYT27DRAFT_7183209 [Phlegmacium glaucopus]|nr:hypothetical protein BYT27DRAFT_7183209 [Phlegmacium glaucopus]